MVKLPSLDELKKMSAELLDSAKTVKLGGVVDKLKSGMESMGVKKTEAQVVSPIEAIRQPLLDIEASLKELAAAQVTQAGIVKKVVTDFGKLNAALTQLSESSSMTQENPDKKG